MFEQHFGLTKRPFDGLAEGADVFVGPQTATLVRKAKKVFTTPDSVVCVSGPIGSGKTTLVGRSLSALGRQHTIIRIGRIKLGPDEVLDFLLRELGLQQMPAGTIQKITVFRNVLKKLEDNDIRLFVIVEDAERLGNVALQELEALTATDSGVSEGANLVLMSENPLRPAMQVPGLKRLEQRSRLHYTLKPMSAPEVRGYLTHGLRQAGGSISGILTDDAVLAAHALSDGIPRVVNNLVSAALESAADKGMQRLDAAELARVAADEFGIDVDALAAGIAPVSETAGQDEPAADPPSIATAEPARAAEPPAPGADATGPGDAAAESEPAGGAVPELIHDTLPEVAALDSGEYPIPNLIHDTLPDLEVLAPEMARASADDGRAAVQAESAEIPDLPDVADVPEIPEVPNLPEVEDPAGAEQPPELAAPDPVSAADLPAADERIANEEIPELAVPELADDAGLDDIPTLFDSSPGMETPAPASEVSHTDPEPAPPAEVPAWDRDPTLAELKPDLEALERAMAVAHGLNKDAAEEPPAVAEEEPEIVPEITLDESIRRKIDVAEAALQATQTLEEEAFGAATDVNIDIDAVAEAAPAPAVEKSKTTEVAKDLRRIPAKADAELERIAAELAKAKSIEDVDDELAETLFGEEFSMIAAQVVANASASEAVPEAAAEPVASPTREVSGDPANDTIAEELPAELSLARTDAGIPSPAHGDTPPSGNGSDLERQFKDLYGEDALEVSMETTPNGMDLSASQRLATVRALNASKPPLPDAGNKPGKPKRQPGPRPDSIEDQINTSLTQTLKGLDVAKVKEMQEAEAAEEEQKSGFFSRFRRS